MPQPRYGSSISRGRRVDEPGVIVKADERRMKRGAAVAGAGIGTATLGAGYLDRGASLDQHAAQRQYDQFKMNRSSGHGTKVVVRRQQLDRLAMGNVNEGMRLATRAAHGRRLSSLAGRGGAGLALSGAAMAAHGAVKRKLVKKAAFVPTSVLSRAQPMAARVAAVTPGAKPGVNAMSAVGSNGGAAGKTAPLAGKATNPGQAQPQSAMTAANSMGSQKPQTAAASMGSMGSMKVQKAREGSYTRTSRRSFDPEEARQRRIGAAMAASGIGGGALIRSGAVDARELKRTAPSSHFGTGMSHSKTVIIDRKAGGKLGAGAAGVLTALQLGSYGRSRRNRRYT